MERITTDFLTTLVTLEHFRESIKKAFHDVPIEENGMNYTDFS